MNVKSKRAGKASGVFNLLRFLSEGNASVTDIDNACTELARSGKIRRASLSWLKELSAADLVKMANGEIGLTEAGRARLARMASKVEPFFAAARR